MPDSAWCMFVATRCRHRNFPSILGCCGLLTWPALAGLRGSPQCAARRNHRLPYAVHHDAIVLRRLLQQNLPLPDSCTAAKICYSITSSARNSSAGEIVISIALAVLRFTTNSNLVGCSIGRSAGFAPRRTCRKQSRSRGSGWKPVADILVSHGYSVRVVQEPETSFDADVAATQRVLVTRWTVSRGRVGLEIEWNNKDPFFDRDLNNFRLLFELRVS
jgi:Restriction endonuclease BglII